MVKTATAATRNYSLILIFSMLFFQGTLEILLIQTNCLPLSEQHANKKQRRYPKYKIIIRMLLLLKYINIPKTADLKF